MALTQIKSGAIADDAIDSSTFADGSIDNAHLAADSVDSDQYVDGSIDLIHMSADSVDSDQYVDGSIDNAHLAANSVDSDQYVDGSIDNAHLADDAVGVAELSATGTASATTFLRGDNAWAEAGGGKLLQVIHSSYATETSATTIVTSGLTVTITPSATDSKIYINYRLANCRRGGHADAYGRLRLYRGDAAYGSGTQTQIYRSSNGFGYHTPSSTYTLDIGDVGGIWLDSPGVTSAVTYTVTVENISGSDGWVKWSTNNATSSMVAMEVSA